MLALRGQGIHPPISVGHAGIHSESYSPAGCDISKPICFYDLIQYQYYYPRILRQCRERARLAMASLCPCVGAAVSISMCASIEVNHMTGIQTHTYMEKEHTHVRARKREMEKETDTQAGRQTDRQTNKPED